MQHVLVIIRVFGGPGFQAGLPTWKLVGACFSFCSGDWDLSHISKDKLGKRRKLAETAKAIMLYLVRPSPYS
jgi:hypothetical protein